MYYSDSVLRASYHHFAVSYKGIMNSKPYMAPGKAPLSIDFLIVGGGIAGLSAALALVRVGHRVRVLEKGDGQTNRAQGGLRAPPNMSKVLFHWGLKPKMREISLSSRPILFSKFHSGDILGVQLWDAELLAETEGEFLLMTHADLYQVLYDVVIAEGVQVCTNAQVVEIEADAGEVKLASGEVLSADIILGADGERGLCRRLVLGRNERIMPTGMTLFDATYDTKLATKSISEELKKAMNVEGNTVFMAFGNGCAATGYPIHNHEDIAFQFFLRDEGIEGSYGDPPSADLSTLMPTPCDPTLLKVANHTSNAVRVIINQYEDLEDWVDDSGHLLLIGQAAHPIAPGAIQGAAMAIEDAAVLAKLFSHLNSREQIESFLYAFQDLRQKRCEVARQSEVGLLALMTMEDGPEQEVRDSDMQTKHKAGKNVFDVAEGEGGVESEQWVEIRTIFGYDCEDEADNWWVQWGMLKERSRGAEAQDGDVVHQPQDGGFSWNAMTIQVNESITP